MTVGLLSLGKTAVSGSNWSTQDGSLNAPAGAAQIPNFFTGFCGVNYLTTGGVRPPWMVSGVDYAVGPRVSTFTDWRTWIATNPAGVFFNSGDNVIYVGDPAFTGTTPSTLTITGIDFTGDSGAGTEMKIWCPNNSGTVATNFVIQDCKFRNKADASVTNICQLNTAGNITIQYCDMNGNGYNMPLYPAFSGFETAICDLNSNAGDTLIQYCWIRDAYQQCIAWSAGPANTPTLLVQFNLIGNSGIGTGPVNSGPHGDWIYTNGFGPPLSGTTFHIANLRAHFNCFYQKAAPTGPSGYGSGPAGQYAGTLMGLWSFNNNQQYYDNEEFKWNTVSSQPQPLWSQTIDSNHGVGVASLQWSYKQVQTIEVAFNYIDSKYMGSQANALTTGRNIWLSPDNTSAGDPSPPFNGTRNVHDNVDLKNGGTDDSGMTGVVTGP